MRYDDEDQDDEPVIATADERDIASTPEFIRLAILVRRKDWNAARRAIDHLETIDREKLNKPFYVSEMGIGERIVNALNKMRIFGASPMPLMMIVACDSGTMHHCTIVTA